MEWTRYLIAVLPAIILFVLGWLIRFRKMYFLISGYNTMSREKKKNVDVAGLGVMMGNTLFVMGGILFVALLLLTLELTVPGLIVMALLVPVIVYLLVGAQKYDGNTRTATGAARPGSKILIGFIIVSILGLVGFVGFMISRGVQTPAAVFAEGTLTVSGLYGQRIPVASMQKVELIETLPKVLRRTNGSAVGSKLNGYFTMEGIGAVTLHLDRSQPPFIYIETAERRTYLNQATPEATRQLFEQIGAARK